MKCPIDGTELKMSERQGVEIDYCPECRGVWLDRGELDKIIEKATPAVVLPDPDPVAPPPVPDPVVAREPRPKRYDKRADEGYRNRSDRDRYRDDYDDDDDDDDDYRHGRRYKKRKRKSILSEIFDFD